MFFQIFLAAVSLFLLYLIYKIVNQFLFRKKFFQLLQKSKTKNFTILPSNFGIGQFIDFINLSEKSYKYWSQEAYKGNDTGVMNLLLQPYLLTTDPEIMKQITITNRLPKASFFYDLLKPVFGNGILLSSGELWKTERTLINPIFSPQNVIKIFNTKINFFNKGQ